MSRENMNGRRRRRRRMQLIKRCAIIFVALIAVITVACILLIPKENHTPLMHTYYAKAAEVEKPAVQVSHEMPKLFADGLCISQQSETLDPSIYSMVAAVYNRTTGEVIYSENADEHYPQASITKMLTFYVALEHGDLSDVVTVKGEWLENLDPGSSVCGIKDGDVITLEQLLYGLMIPSGNDAANAIAYHISGSEEAFVDLMNETAHSIGMTNSHFVNAHGLDDPDHYSSAYDIYLVFNRLLENDFFRQVIGTQQYVAAYTNNGMPVTKTWNRGIWYFTGGATMPASLTGIGGKTGTTPAAKCCLAYAFSDEVGDEYIAIVMYISAPKERLYTCMNILLSKVAN